MLTQEEIRQALHASRSIALGIANPHGPLGLEHLAAVVQQLTAKPSFPNEKPRMQRPVELPAATWEKLDHLAERATQTTAQSVTAAQVAAAILEQYVSVDQS